MYEVEGRLGLTLRSRQHVTTKKDITAALVGQVQYNTTDGDRG